MLWDKQIKKMDNASKKLGYDYWPFFNLISKKVRRYSELSPKRELYFRLKMEIFKYKEGYS